MPVDPDVVEVVARPSANTITLRLSDGGFVGWRSVEITAPREHLRSPTAPTILSGSLAQQSRIVLIPALPAETVSMRTLQRRERQRQSPGQ